MDRHLFKFLELAGVGKVNYERGQEIIHQAADLMKLNWAHLDHSIWRYMSGSRAVVGQSERKRPRGAAVPYAECKNNKDF